MFTSFVIIFPLVSLGKLQYNSPQSKTQISQFSSVIAIKLVQNSKFGLDLLQVGLRFIYINSNFAIQYCCDNFEKFIINQSMAKFQLRSLLIPQFKSFFRNRNVRPRLKGIIVKSTHNPSYKSIDEMWEVQMNNQKPTYKVIDPIGSLKNWYQKANQYWTKAEATYDGVLSGFGNLSQLDIQGSEKFLNQLKLEFPLLKYDSILDCGAGIGRISKQLLCKVFKNVDIIDQCQKYVQKAKQILKRINARHFYCNGLQDFNFEEKYDVVWIQWVLSHLTDQDAVQFFKRAKLALNQNGVIILKENHTQARFIVDKEDFSVTRSEPMYRNLIEKAGLKVIKQQAQVNWPQGFLSVKMYALV